MLAKSFFDDLLRRHVLIVMEFEKHMRRYYDSFRRAKSARHRWHSGVLSGRKRKKTCNGLQLLLKERIRAILYGEERMRTSEVYIPCLRAVGVRMSWISNLSHVSAAKAFRLPYHESRRNTLHSSMQGLIAISRVTFSISRSQESIIPLFLSNETCA